MGYVVHGVPTDSRWRLSVKVVPVLVEINVRRRASVAVPVKSLLQLVTSGTWRVAARLRPS